MTRTPSAWIVLKFGGTSVSSLKNWTSIARIASERHASGARVLIVHSAVSGITDRLERLLEGGAAEGWEERLRAIGERHQALAAELATHGSQRPLGKDLPLTPRSVVKTLSWTS